MPLHQFRRVARRDHLGRNNCVVLDLPDATRLRVWVVAVPGRGNRVRLVVDAPDGAAARAGEAVGREAEAYLPAPEDAAP